ncbi:MAG: social motility TPR repeat lipoprotein Tgl [Myxococcales bacterium]
MEPALTPAAPHARRSLVPLLLFCLAAAPLLTGATCGANRTKNRDQALTHFDLGVQSMQNGDPRAAIVEFQKAIEYDPELAVAHDALGQLYHLAFQQYDKAAEHYQKAVALNPKFSEAYTNLGNLYQSQGRCAEAIPLYEKALSDILYRTPYIAENNLGWCHYKLGDTQKGIDHIRSALVVNARFCLGYRNLGIIYSEIAQPEKATDAFEKYARYCPDAADARHRYAVQLLRAGDQAGARREFNACIEKGGDGTLADECRRLLGLLQRQ